MTGTEDRNAQGDANFPSTPSGSFLSGATIVALLAIIAFLLPGVIAAQAQERLELATVSGGRVYHKWSDDTGASWSAWTDLGAPSGYTLAGTPAVISDGAGRLNVFAVSTNPVAPYNDIVWQNVSIGGSWSGWTRVPGQHLDPPMFTSIAATAWTPIAPPSTPSPAPPRCGGKPEDRAPCSVGEIPPGTLAHCWPDAASSGQPP